MAGKHFAALTTLRIDGSPQTTPVWYVYERGKFIVNSNPERLKVKHLKRDGRVSLLVHEG